MLGSLAKWLRIFGYDTLYPDMTTDDNEVLNIARNQKRLLISRDKELLIRGKKLLLEILEIQTTNLDAQSCRRICNTRPKPNAQQCALGNGFYVGVSAMSHSRSMA